MSHDALLLQNTALSHTMAWTAATIKIDGRVIRNQYNKAYIDGLHFAYTNLHNIRIYTFPPIQTLNLRHTMIVRADIEVLIPSLPRHLQYLILGNNDLSNCNDLLTTLPDYTPELKCLDLFQAQLTSVKDLRFPPALQILILSDNKICDLQFLTVPLSLRKLYLNSIFTDANPQRSLSRKTFPSILPPTLLYLDLSHNSIAEVTFLRLPSTLRTLKLSTQESLGRSTIRMLRELRMPANLTNLMCDKMYSLNDIDIELYHIISTILKQCYESRLCKKYILHSVRANNLSTHTPVAQFIMTVFTANRHIFDAILAYAYNH